MDDENNKSGETNLDLGKGDEGQKEDNTNESWQQRHSLDKFKDVDALAESYKALEKKLGAQNNVKKTSEMSDEELIENNSKVFEGLTDIRTSLDGEYGQLSESISKEFNLPTKFTDAAVGRVVKEISISLSSENKREATEILKDAEQKAAVTAGIKSIGGEYEKGFQERLDKGLVSKEEITVLAKNGAGSIEADLGLDGESFANVDMDAAEEEYLGFTKGEGYAAVSNPSHPQHKEAVSRKAQLERLLKVPKSV